MMTPPDAQFRVCMEVLQQAILCARASCWSDHANCEKIADLMDSVHNIPEIVQHWNSDLADFLQSSLQTYDDKWGHDGGPRLRSIYENAVAETI